MTIMHYYHTRNQFLIKDVEQEDVLKELQTIADLLRNKSYKGWFSVLKKRASIQGMYLWGGVGIGKTYLVDCFYKSLAFKNKLRMHFHEFMHMIHQRLQEHQGHKNPLDIIAKNLAKHYYVICLDEFIVSEIVDAMLLANLLQALFCEQITIIITSNTKPDDLYYRGLQRDKFIPAIELLKKHTQVIHLKSTMDYRRRAQMDTPTDLLVLDHMKHLFLQYACGTKQSYTTIEIADRNINVIAVADDVVWFDFKTICNIPRSQMDYLQLVKRYTTILVSDILAISSEEKNKIRLFITMIDVFYDAKIKFIFSSQVPIDAIYIAGDMLNAFQRTKSRLIEMQNNF